MIALNLLNRTRTILDELTVPANLAPLHYADLADLAERMRAVADQLQAYVDDRMMAGDPDALTDDPMRPE